MLIFFCLYDYPWLSETQSHTERSKHWNIKATALCLVCSWQQWLRKFNFKNCLDFLAIGHAPYSVFLEHPRHTKHRKLVSLLWTAVHLHTKIKNFKLNFRATFCGRVHKLVIYTVKKRLQLLRTSSNVR